MPISQLNNERRVYAVFTAPLRILKWTPSKFSNFNYHCTFTQWLKLIKLLLLFIKSEQKLYKMYKENEILQPFWTLYCNSSTLIRGKYLTRNKVSLKCQMLMCGCKGLWFASNDTCAINKHFVSEELSIFVRSETRLRN